jgi:hypothetical protein
LVTIIAALIVVIEPAWLAAVDRAWLAVVGLLAIGAITTKAFGDIPAEPPPDDSSKARTMGEVRQIRDVEQANDFLVAVDYQLFPFLQRAVRDIAAHRLLVRRNLELERDHDSARHILGEATWHLLQPADGTKDERRWGAVSIQQLAAITDALEKV